MSIYKFGTFINEEWVAHQYNDIWEREKTSGPWRLVIAPATDHIEWMIALASVLPEPFNILYILQVPRGVGEAGRYQSAEPVSREEMETFLRRFRAFLETDGRHEIWIYSTIASATIVYSAHNVLYAYGDLKEYEELLTQRGFHESEVRFPDPHSHSYHVEFDEDERDLLKWWEWIQTPLSEQDAR